MTHRKEGEVGLPEAFKVSPPRSRQILIVGTSASEAPGARNGSASSTVRVDEIMEVRIPVWHRQVYTANLIILTKRVPLVGGNRAWPKIFRPKRRKLLDTLWHRCYAQTCMML
jgi:hypothetical protein